MLELIKIQNENLKLNLNRQSITPITIPEKFIKQDEDPIEIVVKLIEKKSSFLGYKILKVEEVNWHFII